MPINFKGIPTTNGRGYLEDNISEINERLKSFPIEERAAILGTIMEESGGNPLAKNNSGAYQGLLQWGADRYVPQSSDKNTEMNNQIQYILSTVRDKEGGVNWTHGGRGSGYNTKDEAYSTFNNSNAPFKDRYRAFSYGYVRPKGKEDSYNNRLNVARKVLNNLVVNEVLSKPKPKKWTPMKFEQRQFPSKYSGGGDLNADYWDSLPLADKAEMMKVAVANGMTTMPEIRKAYNEFAEGGKIRGKDDDYYDYMVKLADKKAKDWGVDPDILLTRMLNDNEYNYKAFFNMDRKNAMGMLTASPEAHFSDVGKTVYHPTFSNESMYSGKTSDYNPRGTVGGEWRNYEGKEYYIPSESQFANSDINLEETKRYLSQADPNVMISMIGAPDSMLTPEEIRRRNMAKYARLNTYYPITSDYTWTGHSSLTASRLNPNFTLTSKKIDKGGKSKDYNLVTNNCSDATREGLEYVFGKKIDPVFFTTPGDVEDFAKESLGGVERYNGDTMFDPKVKKYIQMTPAQKRRRDKAKGESEVYIPITREEGSKLFDYIEEGKKRNEFAAGGYKPSGRLQKDIALWEGTEMQRNRPFSEMTRQFNATVPKEIQAKLQPNQLDALYSYGYNVGMGRLKERVLPTLTAYTQGKASREDVQKAMWATKDSQLRGLARRRNWERAMFGGNYTAPFEEGKIGVQIDPARYTLPEGFFENMNEQINGIEIPQMQFQGGVDVDPETLYRKPVVDGSLLGSNGNTDIGMVYNPQEEKMEDMERLGMVMKMLGGRGLMGGLGNR